jgi:ABC-type nickel/cobalt efflux system permease component RcnA
MAINLSSPSQELYLETSQPWEEKTSFVFLTSFAASSLPHSCARNEFSHKDKDELISAG